MKNEDLIQKFISGSLSEKEKVQFNNLLETDAEFRSEFEDYKDLHVAFRINEKEELKAHLNSLSDGTIVDSSSWLKNKTLWLAIASCLIIGLFFILNRKSSESIYKEYFDVYPNVYAPVVRGETNAQSEAFQFYESQNYKDATKAFNSILMQGSNANIKFYYAMSLLNQEEYSQAQSVLHELKTESFDYLTEVYWYSALIDLKLEKFEDAKRNLELLKNSDSQFKEDKIESLIGEIDKKLE